ncbi:hypothetical protein ES703_110126 [subsurface metagenome]
MQQEVAFVTDDKWVKEQGGCLDITDRQILNEASQNGRVHVRVINIQEMLEGIRETEPKKYRSFQKEMEKQAGKRLTFEEVVELGRKADERMKEFTKLTESISLAQAAQIRILRVDYHMTWRSVARTCYLEKWPNLRGWEPSSNQLMGMSLCEKAAEFFNENYREPPWN